MNPRRTAGRRSSSTTTRGVAALIASLLTVGASVAPAEAAEPATASYHLQGGATITSYTPTSSEPLTTTGSEPLTAQFTLRREATSPFFGSTSYTVLDMTLRGTTSGRTFTSIPGATTDRLVCFPDGCQPEVALTDSLTDEVVTLRGTGIAPFGFRPTDAGTYPQGYDWTDARNVYTEGGLGLYREGTGGLQIVAAVRGMSTRDSAPPAEPATAVYYLQGDATITDYTPSSNAPLTTTGSEYLTAQFTLRREATSPFFGSTYYTVLDMTLQGVPSGRTLTSLPGSTTDRLVCFPADCQPEVQLLDSLSGQVVTLRTTGIAPFGFRPADAGTYPLAYNWTDARNIYTEGGLGLYRNGTSGLEIVAAVRGVSTRDSAPPSVQLSSPSTTRSYVQDEVVAASYRCSDPAGVTECAGPVPSGGRVDTSVVGRREFTIWTTDGWGNRTDYTFRYTVVAPDLAPPVVSLALDPAPPGGEVERGSTPPVVALSCTDDVAVASCTATLDGVPIASGAAVDTSVVGTHTLAAEAVDTSAKVTNAELTYTVVDPPPPPPLPPGAASEEVTGGEVVTTDPEGTGATAEVPVQTSITVPEGVTGTVSVTPVTPGAAPTGFSLFGKQLVIEGPAATATDPYTMSLTVDGSALAGIAPSDVQVFRNGVAVTGCTSPTAAIPDPCVVSRGFAPGGGGDALVTVRTSRFSTWAVGRVDYDLSGPLAPLRPLPTANKIKGGDAVPVTFRLGGDRGADVLVDQRPRVVAVSCTTGAPTGQEVAATAGRTPAVAYSSKQDAYVYVWRSPKNLKGCHDLVLRFRDGDELRIRFRLQ